MRMLRIAAPLAFLVYNASAYAQQTPKVSVLTVSQSVRTDPGAIQSISFVRALSTGDVVILDQSRQRLVLFDSTLKHFKTLADTASGAPRPFPPNSVPTLLPFLGDSSVFVDPDARALIVIEPTGKFGRVMAPAKASDLGYLTFAPNSSAGFDPQGRMVYRTNRSVRPVPAGASAYDGGGRASIRYGPDSAPIMRGDLNRRIVDTVAMLHVPPTKLVTMSLVQGTSIVRPAFDPLPQTDEWTLLPDGTIAIVRGHDYHIDWVDPTGRVNSTPKMPFDWKPITAEERQSLIDGLKKADSTRRANNPAPPPEPGREGSNFAKMPFMTLDANELPDFYPPVRTGQVRASPDGNVWILPTTSLLSTGDITGPLTAATGGLVYDVVNRNGIVIERVRLPEKRVLVGLGPHGVVYMNYAPAPGMVYLERGRIQR